MASSIRREDKHHAGERAQTLACSTGSKETGEDCISSCLSSQDRSALGSLREPRLTLSPGNPEILFPGPSQGPHLEWRIPRAQPALCSREGMGASPWPRTAPQAPTTRDHWVFCSFLCSHQHPALCFSQFLASNASPTGVTLLLVSFVPQVGACFTRNSPPYN